LIKNSHGFRPGRSCTTNLLTFLELTTAAKDNGKPMDTVYLDFSKGFDNAPHKRLLKKMEAKRISKEVQCWTGESEMSGVPQGTVLGPCLFFMSFIDDADHCVVGQTVLIKPADDTKGLRTVETDQNWQELQSTLDKLCDWADAWGMSFNVEKC
jgi:type I restriction-modification system DNA methylase subunit